MRHMIRSALVISVALGLAACEKPASPATDAAQVPPTPEEQTGTVERTAPEEQTGTVERTEPEEQ